jgi:hypothetical protein
MSHGHASTPFESEAGPLHQVSRPFSWSAFTPLEKWSAVLSTPGQCFHCVGVVYVCISVTRIQTKGFHLLGLLRIQLRATVASVHNVASLMSKPVSQQKYSSSIAPTSAARSSRRGRVIFFTGTSLFLLQPSDYEAFTC